MFAQKHNVAQKLYILEAEYVWYCYDHHVFILWLRLQLILFYKLVVILATNYLLNFN